MARSLPGVDRTGRGGRVRNLEILGYPVPRTTKDSLDPMRPAPPLLAAPALLLSALVLLPFHDKAFTVDDTVFLREAEHALVDPLHPTAFDYPWNTRLERLSTIVPTGPMGAWVLVPAVWAGGSETVAHLTTLAFLWLAILATVSLGLQLGLDRSRAAAAGLLLAASPAVLAMAGTVMPDVLAMALGVAGLERLIAWRRGGGLLAGMLASLCLGLAPLARTHLVLLLPVGALLLVDDLLAPAAWRQAVQRRWLPLLAAAVITWAGTALTRDPAGTAGTIQGALVTLSGLEKVPKNTVAFLVHWVTTMTLGLAWVALRWRALLARWWLALAGSAVAALLLRLGHGAWLHLPIAGLAGLGMAVLGDALVDALRRRDQLQVVLWLCLLIPLPAVVYIHLPAKYLLAAAPAASLLLARRLPEPTRWTWSTVGLVASLGVLLGVALLRADSALAGAGQRAAATLIAPRVAAGERVWFVGHWGFQWYAERAGASFLQDPPPYPKPGDVVVASRTCAPHIDIVTLPREFIFIGGYEEPGSGGRVMDLEAGAGFYSNVFGGYLPWAWSEKPADSFLVGRLVTPR